MNGIKFLLDTNILIGLLNGHRDTMSLLEENHVSPDVCAYSSITRMELLGWAGMTTQQSMLASSLLASMHRIPVGPAEEDAVISLRRVRKIKLPDAIIVATAKANGLQLLTLDRQILSLTSEH